MSRVRKILVVRNNPRDLSKSNLHKLETSFLDNFKGENVEFKYHDLYNNDFPRIDKDFFGFLMDKNKEDYPKEYHDKYQHKLRNAEDFAWADLIMIVSPYWTGIFPSALKDWFDLLPVKDVTIFEGEGGTTTIGKDSGKKLLLLQTSGDVSTRNSITNWGKKYIMDAMRFYGIKEENKKYIIAEGSYLKSFDEELKIKTQELNEYAKEFLND